jgi:hypothetical protein
LTDRRLTPAVERLATLTGAVADSFDKGADLLAEMAAIDLSEATVQRTTENAGARLAEALNGGQTLGPAADWDGHRNTKGRPTAYVSIDATGVRQQAEGGAAAEGRMAYVGMVFNPPPDPLAAPERPRRPMKARYLSGLYALDQMGPLLRRQAAQVGMERAEVWVALTDGGNGLEDFVRDNFNRSDLVVILDYWRAASYLEDLARACHPQDEAAAQALAGSWCSLLKAEGGAATLAVLREGDWGGRLSPAAREQWHRVQEYFEKNVHRMEYPEYRAEGWHIGSGVVESACKTVVGQRLKGAGKRWGEDGVHQVCHIRALYRSEKGQWEAFWTRKLTKTKVYQPN